MVKNCKLLTLNVANMSSTSAALNIRAADSSSMNIATLYFKVNFLLPFSSSNI